MSKVSQTDEQRAIARLPLVPRTAVAALAAARDRARHDRRFEDAEALGRAVRGWLDGYAEEQPVHLAKARARVVDLVPRIEARRRGEGA